MNRNKKEIVRWFDAHLHWQAEAWAGTASAAAERARAAGVDGWCCCGTQPADWPAVAEWGRAFPGQVTAYGLHPWFIERQPADWAAQLRARLAAEPAAAVGEFGLDHGLASYDPAAQTEAFRIQWDLARELDRVAILHCRRAWQALDECLRAAAAPCRGFVLHAYSGSAEMVPALARQGAFFSFSGTALTTGSGRGAAALRAVPPARLLLETDAPDLLPADLRARGYAHNEPALLPEYGASAATLLNCSPADLAARTRANARRLFGLAPVPPSPAGDSYHA